MSDEPDEPPKDPPEDAPRDASGEAPKDAAAPERRDEDGLPLDRPPTLDDVRGTEGSGRTIAIGCGVAVLAVVLAFWLLRAYLLG